MERLTFNSLRGYTLRDGTGFHGNALFKEVVKRLGVFEDLLDKYNEYDFATIETFVRENTVHNLRGSIFEKLEVALVDNLKRKYNVDVADIEALLKANAEGQIYSYWDGWTCSAYIGLDEEEEPRYAERIFYRCHKCRRGTVVKSAYCPGCGALMEREKSDGA